MLVLMVEVVDYSPIVGVGVGVDGRGGGHSLVVGVGVDGRGGGLLTGCWCGC